MSLFVILLAGTLTPTPRLLRQVAGARAIAADGGMAHAATLGLAPELWAGDFDSADADLLARYAHVPRVTYPAEKDSADGDIAVAEALARGASRLVLCGAFGGQFDHMLMHAGLALKLAHAGLPVLLTSGLEEAVPLLPGTLALDLPPGSAMSVMPLSDFTGLDLGGVKWPLRQRDVPLGSSLTLSNVVTGPVRVALGGGYGVIIAYPGANAP